jgi:hypothetical protein
VYQPDKSVVVEHSTESGHLMKLLKTEVGVETSGYMYSLVKETTDIKLHLDNMNKEERFKPNKARNSSTRFFKHANTHTSRKFQEDTEKNMIKRKQSNRQQRHQVKQHGGRLESDG